MTRVIYGQSGYSGTRMSNRAIAAYDNGEKPLSKWTKTEILSLIEAYYGNAVAKAVSKMTADDLKLNFLYRSSWHHTGSYASRTDFYSFKDDVDLSHLIQRPKQIKEKPTEHWAVANWTEWTGTRKHPKKTDRKSVITWTEANGKKSMVKVLPSGEQKLFTSFRNVRMLKSKPKSNATVWKELY